MHKRQLQAVTLRACFTAGLALEQDLSLVVQVSTDQTVVSANEGSSVATTIQNIGTKERSVLFDFA